MGIKALPDMWIQTAAAVTGRPADGGVHALTTSAAQLELIPAAATTLMRPAAAWKMRSLRSSACHATQ